MTVTLVAPASGVQFQARSGNTYTANSSGLITANLGDVAELINNGCQPVINNIQETGNEYVGYSVVAAAGSSQTTATPLTTAVTIIASGSANSGLILPSTPITASGNSGNDLVIINGTANNILIYPAVGHTVNSYGTNVAYTLPAGLGLIGGGLTSTSWTLQVANIPSSFQYNTNTAVTSATLTAANISSSTFGFIDVTLNLTGTLIGAANATLPTVASLVAAITNFVAGQQWKLRIINSSSGNYAWTVVTNTGWGTLNGTMTIAQNTFRDFYVICTSATAATLQSTGTGTYS